MIRWCFSVLLVVVQICDTQALNYQCEVCPTGKYKSGTSNNDCVSCPADTYQDSLGAVSVTQCKPCPSNSYAPVGSKRATDCLCGLGYSGDVATFLTGAQNENLQRSCGAGLNVPCATSQSKDQITSANAVDASMTSQSFALYPLPTETNLLFQNMKTWWRVRFEREAVVQSLNIYNIEATKLQSFSIRVGNLEPFNLQEQNTLCASNVQWPAGAPNLVVTCTQAVRGQYLYIINGNQGNIILNNVQVIGYLLPASEVCVACSSGKYKASSGTAACSSCDSGTASPSIAATSSAVCTTCPVNTYSDTASGTCTGCPSNSLAAAGSTSREYCRCDRGYTPAPSTIDCSAFQALYQAKKPWAHYSADGWNSVTRVLADQSGNNRHASGSPGSITGPMIAQEAGALNPVAFLRGSTAASLQFAQNSIALNFTVCSVTKYASTDPAMQQRILTATEDVEWWHGHYSKKRGVAKFASQEIKAEDGVTTIASSVWNTAQGGSSLNMNWTVMCSKNGGITPWNVLVDGQAAGTSTRSDSDPAEWPGLTLESRTANMQLYRAKSMCINCVGQKSAWDFAQLLIWDYHLNDVEMQTVSLELQKYTSLSTVCSVLPGVGCVACPAGKYKSAIGGGTCVDCMAGKYRTGTAAIGDNLCIDCPANTFALPGSTLQTDCKCNAGYSGAANGVACVACAAGKYKTDIGIGTCTDCPADQYSTTVAQVTSVCSSCPSFSQAPSGSDEAIDCKCNAGYTGPNGGVCFACVQGTYKTAIGPNTCTLCGNNTYSSVEAATTPTVCAACQGNSTSLRGSTRQSDCHCLLGFLTNNLGAANATCQICSAGSYNSQLGATTCSKCGGGFKSSTPGAVSSETCTECGADTYSAAGAAQCEICPSNTFAPARSQVLTDCKCLAGYYSQALGQDGRSCSACQEGKYKPQTGAVACTDCSVNRYSTATAATSNTSCQSCIANAVSPVSSSASSQCLCDFGYMGTKSITNMANSCSGGGCPVIFPEKNWAYWELIMGNSWCSQIGTSFGDRTTECITDGIVDNSNTGNAFIQTGNAYLGQGQVIIDFQREIYVTGVTVYFGNAGITYSAVSIYIGNGDLMDSQNRNAQTLCTNLAPVNPGSTVTVNCGTTMRGSKFALYSNQKAILRIREVMVMGYDPAAEAVCTPCTAGKYKDTLGSAACTNCPADHYSGLTASTSNATCTPCYENSVSAPGSVSMDACSCVAGYEFT